MRARPFPFVGDADAEVVADVVAETAAGSNFAGDTTFRFDGEAILSAGLTFTCRPSS